MTKPGNVHDDHQMSRNAHYPMYLVVSRVQVFQKKRVEYLPTKDN
jgi:hypothetical protein